LHRFELDHNIPSGNAADFGILSPPAVWADESVFSVNTQRLHCPCTPTTTVEGGLCTCRNNLKLFTSMRRPSERKSACGSPQHRTLQPRHHLKINEGPVSRGGTLRMTETASLRPANPDTPPPKTPDPTKSPRVFAVSHHQYTIQPGG
jgi:hypothetical protein